MEQVFKTKITEMLGIDHPILCGGMQWISRAEFVAAICNAGAFGFITAAQPDGFLKPAGESAMGFDIRRKGHFIFGNQDESGGNMMHRKGSKWVGVYCLLCLVGWAGNARAVYIDDERTLEFVGKAQTRTSIRLQHSEGFTHPLDIAAGNVVQWRNLAVFEINHDLMNLTHDLDILYPLKALDISAKYHIVGRFMYEAIYDVGPQAFQDVRDE